MPSSISTHSTLYCSCSEVLVCSSESWSCAPSPEGTSVLSFVAGFDVEDGFGVARLVCSWFTVGGLVGIVPGVVCSVCVIEAGVATGAIPGLSVEESEEGDGLEHAITKTRKVTRYIL